MKNILMLNYEFPPLGGGGGRVSLSLARGFIRKGYRVDVITSRYGRLSGFEVIDGINVHRVSVWGRQKKQTATFISMFCYLLTGFFCGLKLCTRNKYCFINTHFVLPTGPLGFLLSKMFRLKNILSIHGGDIYDPSKKSSPHNKPYLRWVVRFLLNHSDKVVAQSSNTKQNAEKYYQPVKTIAIIPLSYETFNFKPVPRMRLGLKNDTHYVIGVGRIVKRKGFDYLIRSLVLLDDSVELLIVGDGDERKNLYDLTCKLKLAKRVHFLGEIPEVLKFQYLSNADIFVLSSLHEGFGIVLQEAMQVGLPIVATNNGGQVDIVKDRVNGLLIKPGNVNALAEAINMLLTDSHLCRRISQNNIKALKKFEPDSIIDNYLALIQGSRKNICLLR